MTMQSRIDRLKDAASRLSLTDCKEMQLTDLESLNAILRAVTADVGYVLHKRLSELSTETVHN